MDLETIIAQHISVRYKMIKSLLIEAILNLSYHEGDSIT